MGEGQTDFQRRARKRKAELEAYYPLGDGRMLRSLWSAGNPMEGSLVIGPSTFGETRFGAQTLDEAIDELRSLKPKGRGGTPTSGRADTDSMQKAERARQESLQIERRDR